jgi:hypothetical protein
MDRRSIATGGAKKDPLCHYYQRWRKLISNKKKIFQRKGCHQCQRGRMLDTIIFIDVNIVQVMISNLRRDNVVGCAEDIA